MEISYKNATFYTSPFWTRAIGTATDGSTFVTDILLTSSENRYLLFYPFSCEDTFRGLEATYQRICLCQNLRTKRHV